MIFSNKREFGGICDLLFVEVLLGMATFPIGLHFFFILSPVWLKEQYGFAQILIRTLEQLPESA